MHFAFFKRNIRLWCTICKLFKSIPVLDCFVSPVFRYIILLSREFFFANKLNFSRANKRIQQLERRKLTDPDKLADVSDRISPRLRGRGFENYLIVILRLLLHQFEPARTLHVKGTVALQGEAALALKVRGDVACDQLLRPHLPFLQHFLGRQNLRKSWRSIRRDSRSIRKTRTTNNVNRSKLHIELYIQAESA